MTSRSGPVGVMGYQGATDAHLAALRALGIAAKPVRLPEDLQDISGLILPGGESSVQFGYCQRYGLVEAIKAFAQTNRPILGTCAGAILLSSYQSDKISGFGLLDVEVTRNLYGRQMASGIYRSDEGHDVLFIRAPGIMHVHDPRIQVRDRYRGLPILIQREHIVAATYHPELLHVDTGPKHLLYEMFAS